MSRNINLQKNEKIIICGHKYELIENLSPLRGFQFRTWKVKKGDKSFVTKITTEKDKALRELRTIIYLKTFKYPDRYYADLLLFNHEAKVVRENKEFKFLCFTFKVSSTR